jgi:hypothetical protein
VCYPIPEHSPRLQSVVGSNPTQGSSSFFLGKRGVGDLFVVPLPFYLVVDTCNTPIKVVNTVSSKQVLSCILAVTNLDKVDRNDSSLAVGVLCQVPEDDVARLQDG